MIATLLLGIAVVMASSINRSGASIDQSEDGENILAMLHEFYTEISSGSEISHEFDYYALDGVFVWNGTEVRAQFQLIKCERNFVLCPGS